MFKVYDTESARTAYKAIETFEKLNFDKDYIDDIKRNVREWTHRTSYLETFFDGDITRRMVKDYGIDGFIELIKLPEEISNTRWANIFFYEHIYIEPTHSIFDCTGKTFTGWYKLFKRKDGYYVYHHVCVDV